VPRGGQSEAPEPLHKLWKGLGFALRGTIKPPYLRPMPASLGVKEPPPRNTIQSSQKTF
jgi:hypothetical protein